MNTIISKEKSKSDALPSDPTDNLPTQVDSLQKKKDICKLEYYVTTFEREVLRLSKENRELKEKLKKFNLSNSTFTGTLSIENQSFELKKSLPTLNQKIFNACCFSLEGIASINFNGTPIDTQNENMSIDSYFDKAEISSRNHNPNSRGGSQTRSRSSHEIKIMELSNKILRMKSLIQRKNSMIEQYEVVLKSYKAAHNDLILSKKNLCEINKKMKANTTSMMKSNSENTNMLSFNKILEKEMQSEYKSQIQQLKEIIDTTQINSKSRQTDLELSHVIIENLKNKLNDTNFQLINTQKNYSELEKNLIEARSINESLHKKYKNHKAFLKSLQDNLQTGEEIFQYIEEYFNLVKEENGKRFTSFLFSNEMDLDKIDISNVDTMIAFIRKINDVNFIIKISAPGQLFSTTGLKEIKLSPEMSSRTLEGFSQRYTHYIQKFVSMFGIIAKILVNENAKNFFFANNLNKLFKRFYQITGGQEEKEKLYTLFTKELRFHESKISKLVLDKVQLSTRAASTTKSKKQPKALQIYLSTVSNYFSGIERYLNQQNDESDIDS